MATDSAHPWRVLTGAEGRAARLDEVRRLSGDGLTAQGIADRMEVARWVVERDLDTLRDERAP